LILDKSALKLVSVAEGSLLSIISIGIRFLKRHIISVMSKSFDEGCSPFLLGYFHETIGQKSFENFM
jgi:pilus assembly protein TadC